MHHTRAEYFVRSGRVLTGVAEKAVRALAALSEDLALDFTLTGHKNP